MKIVNFIGGQNSPDWHDWRRNGIGASDIAVLRGTSPYKTQLELWNEKNNFSSSDVLNKAMLHGIESEEKARAWLNENLCLNLEPLCIEDNEISYIRASLDGYDKEHRVVSEIKSPVSEEILTNVREKRIVPLHWLDQIQWQIMISQPVRAFIAVWDYRYESCITIDQFALPEIHKDMRAKSKDFWRLVQCGIQPPLSDKDYIVIEDPELERLLLEYQDHNCIEQSAKENKKILKEQIVEFGDDGNFLAYGFKIARVRPRIVYDTDKMKMDGIDIDQYIKKSDNIGFYRISVPKD